MDNTTGTHQGGCLCGALRFEVSADPLWVAYCHCRSCRLAAGAPFVAWASFPVADFTLTKGNLSAYTSSSDVTRGFCGSCGTALTYAHRARASELDIALATLDDASSIPPEFHIWVSHKLPWVVLSDGLPQYPEWREGAV